MAGTGNVVGREAVELVEALKTDAIALGDAVHRLACLDSVRNAFHGFVGLGAFLLQIEDVAGLWNVVLGTFVVAAQFTLRHASHHGESGKIVAGLHYDVVVAVVGIYGVRREEHLFGLFTGRELT